MRRAGFRRRAADEQHSGQVRRGQPGRADRAAQRLDGPSIAGRIVPSNSPRVSRDCGTQLRQQHRDRHLGVRPGQCLLRLGALPAQPGHRGVHRLIGRVQPVRPPARPASRARDRLVEVHPTQAIDAFGATCIVQLPFFASPPRRTCRHPGRTTAIVELDSIRSALAYLHGRRLRPGQEGRAQPDPGQRTFQQLLLVLAPGRRVGHRDPRRRTTLALRDPIHHPTHQTRRQIMSQIRLTAHHQRRLVPDPTLELRAPPDPDRSTPDARQPPRPAPSRPQRDTAPKQPSPNGYPG